METTLRTRPLAAVLQRASDDCAECLAAGGVFVVVGPSAALTGGLPEQDLHAEDLRRAAIYERSLDRTNFLAGRHLLARLLHRGQAGGTLACAPSGKPLPVGGVHFNLSHSDAWVVLALTRTGPLGVDIEARASFARFAAVVDRISHPDERAWTLVPGDPRLGLLRRLQVWTRKEALLKATGEGLGFDAVRWSALAPEAAPNGAGRPYVLSTFTGPDEAWVLSVAHRSTRPPQLLRFTADTGD